MFRTTKQHLYPNRRREDRKRNDEPLSKTLKRWAIIAGLFGFLALLMKLSGAL